jgi:hypothetical protein
MNIGRKATAAEPLAPMSSLPSLVAGGAVSVMPPSSPRSPGALCSFTPAELTVRAVTVTTRF